MGINAKAKAIIEAMEGAFPTPTDDMTADELRHAVHAAASDVIQVDPEPVASVEDLRIGAVPVRVYRPDGARGTLVFLHGGGFVLCDLDSHDAICRAIANAAGATLVAVDYRLAPEHPYPAALEDAYAVLEWAATLDERLGVIGDSAGGGLAAELARYARDRGGPTLGLQVLVYPMLDPACDTPSHTDTGPGYFLKSAEVQWYWKQYLQDTPYAAPTDVHDLPPALVITAENDPLRDEGEAYGEAMRAAGVEVTVTRYDDTFHSFLSFLGILDEAFEARDEIGAAIRKHLG